MVTKELFSEPPRRVSSAEINPYSHEEEPCH